MRKTAILIILLTFFSKLFGFFREMILAFFYGASNTSDAYLIANSISGTVFAFISVAIATSFIPLYSKIENKEGDEEARTFTNQLLIALIVICTVIVFFVMVFTEPVVRIFASGFKGDTLKLAILFTRISIFAIYFSSSIHIMKGYLNIKGNYFAPAIAGIPLNATYILTIILSSLFSNPTILAFGIPLAIGIEVLFLVPFIRQKGFKFNIKFNINNKYLKEITKLSMPVILGVSVNQINIIVDKTLAWMGYTLVDK